MLGRPRLIAPEAWPTGKELPGRALLDYFLGIDEATATPDGITLTHEVVAGLTETQARLVGLPPSIPHALQLQSMGRLDEQDFGLRIRWLKASGTPAILEQSGSIAREGEKTYRIPRVLMQILGAAEAFNTADTTSRAKRIEQWLPVQQALQAATGEDIQPDGYLEDLRIFHAGSLSLSVEMSKEQGVTFDPILFGRGLLRRQRQESFDLDPLADPAQDEDEGETRIGLDSLVDECDQLLPPELHEVFLRNRFDRDPECREAYPLERNTYLVLDEELRVALNLVKAKQSETQSERLAFLKNPRAAFADALGKDPNDHVVEGLFVETQQYADRVTGIGLWTPKVLPWLPTSPNTWLPEKIGFYIGGRTVEIAPERLEEIKVACEGAMQAGETTFSHQGVEDIPATEETLRAIEELRAVAAQLTVGKESPGEDTPTTPAKPEEPIRDRFALEQKDNIEELAYTLGLKARKPATELEPPSSLIDPNRLYPHQREGFDWMVKNWTAGRPGILLADDMGLGKTIQALAFAAWLHSHYEQASNAVRGPMLVVAPTALLRNWRSEHDRHLVGGGLGPIVELYGSAISGFRKESAGGRDVAAGHAVLDREKLSSASLILTTYETLANYHISFAAIHFPLVVFDEIQKLKTPTTINTHAAKTINADFVIGLTGTPVENNLTELWSIMDRLHPGLFADLRSFNQRFTPTDRGALQELRDILVRSVPPGSSVMLRRMKDTTNLGTALPPRHFKPKPANMSAVQAEAYATCVTEAKRAKEVGAAQRGSMLKVLQQMRSISLHPEHPLSVLGQPALYDRYIEQSARLRTAIDLLDDIHARREKALVFIEFREMQNVIADILRHRYKLQAMPSIINGQTPSARRQELVDEFQQRPHRQFDVMILAPRAAGVGLNITAANHVIHLSRWWNPAVEDQCNDRAYRIGQDKPVTVYYPIARHPAFGDSSFDVTLDRLLARKRDLSRDLLIPMETEDDYREMFESTIGPESENEGDSG